MAARTLRPMLLAALAAGLVACGGGGADAGTSAGTSTGTGGTPATPGGGSTGGTPLSATRSGEGTFYGATGAGNCSYEASPQDLMVAAMNQTDYADSAICGAFVEATGPKGTVTVRIVDRCPECQPGDIDFSAEAFARIADPVAGRVPITWQVVAGNVSGPVSYRYKEGSTRFWTAIQVRNHRLPITALAIRPAGAGAWIEVPRLDYNYFVHPVAIASGPLQVRITAAGGAQLIDTLPEPAGGTLTQGLAQIP